jgi:hypothetical protein
MGSLNGARRRLAIDPWVVICCVAALAVYLLHGLHGTLLRDNALYSYAGQQVAEGVPPYVGVFNRAGPLAHLIPGMGVLTARALAVDDLLGIRILFMLLAVASIGVTYLLGRELFQSRLAGLASAAALLSFEHYIHEASTGPREKTAMVLFLVVALLAMTRQSWLLTGIFLSLATLTWQPVFLPAICGVLAAVLVGVDRGVRIRVLGLVAVGGLIPAGIAVGAFLVVSELERFLDGFLLVNASDTTPSHFLKNPAGKWRTMLEGYGISFWVLFGGLIAHIVATVQTVRRLRCNRDAVAAALVGTGVLSFVGIAWTMWDFDGPPDLFVLLPGGALGVGALIASLMNRGQVRTGIILASGFMVAAIAFALVYAIGERSDGLARQRAEVFAILEALHVDEAAILSVEAPQPLVLSGQRNASDFQMFGPGLVNYVDDVWPGGIEGYGRWIAEQGPMVIAVGRRSIPKWLVPTLEADYRSVGHAPGWTWFVTTDLGSDRIQDIRQALRAIAQDPG